jgi:hypothetical protein
LVGDGSVELISSARDLLALLYKDLSVGYANLKRPREQEVGEHDLPSKSSSMPRNGEEFGSRGLIRPDPLQEYFTDTPSVSDNIWATDAWGLPQTDPLFQEQTDISMWSSVANSMEYVFIFFVSLANLTHMH